MKVALEKHPEIKAYKGAVDEKLPRSHQYYFSAENRGLHLSKMFDKNTRSAAVKVIKEKEDRFLAELKKGYPIEGFF